MKNSFWNADKILSITAILLSLGTFIVFTYQTQLIRKHQYASVMPYLQIGNAGGGTPNYRLTLKNKGIGPAIIRSIRIRKDKIEYFEDPHNFLARIKDADNLDYYYTNLQPGMFVQAGEMITLIGVNKSITTSDSLLNIINDLDIFIQFESIYGQRWESRYGNAEPREIL